MPWIAEQFRASERFVESGGWVLLAILVVTLVMWTLLLERWRRFGGPLRRQTAAALAEWRARPERTSWHAHQIRRELISRVAVDLRRSSPVIRVLVAICPLLGILGTVTGMIEVFDGMAVTGSGSSRAMAHGVSRATIPTMAGMVAALSGLMASTHLERRATAEIAHVTDALAPEVGP